MATYLILNIVLLVLVLGILCARRGLVWSRASVVTLLILLVCTAVFDSLIIAADIVRYDWNLNLGVVIGAAPVEDFFYSILAAIVIPSVWQYGRGKVAE